MLLTPLAAFGQSLRGIAIAIRSRAGIVLGVTAAVAAFNLVAPVAILSLVRRPFDYFTFNPWLSRLPEYLESDESLTRKLSFLSQMAIAWVSADNKVEGIDWGFIVDVPTLTRILLTSLVFGTFFALWSYRKQLGEACGLVIAADGTSLYFAGDTCVFGDMKIIGDIYKPDVAILPIGGHFTMDPVEAAYALDLLGVKRCVPCHYGTFPLLKGTPDELRALARGVEVISPEPGETIEL